VAKSLVENLGAGFEPERYDDTFRSELLDLIRSKAEGRRRCPGRVRRRAPGSST
jgi:non-homologous end joining protein Ku